VERNHIQILRDFLALRFWQGESRELPDYLKYPGEFPENKKVQREEAEQIVPPESYERDNKRIVFREWSGLQGGWEAGIFPQATDAQLEIAQAMAGLRKEVRTFAELAHDPGEKGLRKFVKTFAYYLRRTCIERPCSARLEQILRIAYEDECFPYTNGLFLGDSTDKPRWKECAKAACVPLAGVTLNAARCQCYTYQAPGPPQPVAPSNTPPPDFCVKKNDSNP
jgi:hypothetical protein